MRRLPPLTALPAFEATARLGSVRAAAEELGRTPGAVSKQLRHLAEDLGTVLFEREGTGLQLTEEGARLLTVTGRSLDALDEEAQRLRMQAGGRAIEVALSATFAMRWLVPRLPRFYARMPKADVRLLMAGYNDAREARADVILTWDRLRWNDPRPAHLRTIADTAYGLVTADPDAIRRDGDRWRIATRVVQTDRQLNWTRWQQMTGIALEIERDIELPHTFLVLEAAAAGMGVALTERRLVETELSEGTLQAPFGFQRVAGGLGAFVSDRAATRTMVTAFIDWLTEEAVG